MADQTDDAGHGVEYCVNIVRSGAAIAKYRCAGCCRLPPRRAQRKILPHHSKRRRKVGEKVLGGHWNASYNSNIPAAERLRDNIGKTISRYNSGDRLLKRHRCIPRHGNRSQCELPTPVTVRVWLAEPSALFANSKNSFISRKGFRTKGGRFASTMMTAPLGLVCAVKSRIARGCREELK